MSSFSDHFHTDDDSAQQDSGLGSGSGSDDYSALNDLISHQDNAGGDDDAETQDDGQDNGQVDDGTATDTADGPYPTQTDDGSGDYGMGGGTDYFTTTVDATSDAFPTTAIPTLTSAFIPAVTATPSTLTAMPSATANSQSTDGNGSTSKKSSGSAAAIGVTVTILILAACAALFFFIRKKHMNNRNKRRATWTPPFNQDSQGAQRTYTDLEGGGGRDADHFETIDINEKQGATILPDNITYQTVSNIQRPIIVLPASPPPLHPTGYAPLRMPSPPPISDGTPYATPSPVGMDVPSFADNTAPLISSTQFASAIAVPHSSAVALPASAKTAFGAHTSASGALVVVARTFVPSLPDELRIQTGEQVRLVCRYDDGWALVERMKSGSGVESGVVPLECLEPCSPPTSKPSGPSTGMEGAMPGMGLAQLAVEGWRLSKRKSSLQPAGPTLY